MMALSRNKPLERHTPMRRGASRMKRTELRKVSKKRARENRERTAMKKEFFPVGMRCSRPDCWAPYEDIHEPLTRARGGEITDPDNSVPLCRSHHDELGDEPVWAYEEALLVHSWEKTPTSVLASVRRQLLAGGTPVEGIAYCRWCRLWLPFEHGCPYDEAPF